MMLNAHTGGVTPTDRFDIMPWGVVRGTHLVARAWTRESANGATGSSGTFRGCTVVPMPVAGRTS